MEAFEIHPIKPGNNVAMAAIIREVLTEYQADKPGTAFADPMLDKLSDCYDKIGGRYYVALLNGKLVGGCGVGPLENEPGMCELQKMYILPEARRLGIGTALIQTCLNFAQKAGYQACYLETLPDMTAARKLYQKHGFKQTSKRYGNTGHFFCDYQMIKMFD